MAFNSMNISPNEIWSWRIGHYYLRDDLSGSPTALGPGEDIVSSTIMYRLNENWGLRASHYYDVRLGKLQEQSYTVYRDLRSWTAALSFLVRQGSGGSPHDYAVAFTFSLKAYPRFSLGSDLGGPYSLMGTN
jgi:hypothetical protein